MLDTNVAIAMGERDLAVIDHVQALPGSKVISSVTLVELEGGVYAERADREVRRFALDTLLSATPVLPFDADAARLYGRIVARDGFSRRKIVDRMIAAHAMHVEATLVTLNPRDFAAITGLKLVALDPS